MKLIRLTLFLACFSPSLQEPLPLVVSAALSRYYTGLPWKPRTALAVAYLLREPKVEVRAVAAGFSPSSFLTRHFGIHPCQAAENFLSDMGKAEIPVVCGAKTGFLGPDKVEKVLAKLMEGGAHWLVLDSWSAAAAVTLPSSGFRTQILSFLLPGPGLLYHENAVSHPLTQSIDETMSSPGLLLRSWQDSFKEALPRLKILGLAPGWRKVSLMGSNFHRCSGSWMHREFGRGQIAEVAYQQALRIARAISISSITTSVEGMLQFFMPQDDHALLLAAAMAMGNFTMCTTLHAGPKEDTQALQNECRKAFVEDPPDTMYVQVNVVSDGSTLLQRVIERMCDVKLGSTQKGPEEL